MTLPDSLAALRQACAEPLLAAQRAHAAGSRVVAYLGNATPVELILAAGAFPLEMRGDAREETPLATRFIDDDFDGDLKSVYQRIVSGHFNLADLIVIPRSSNGYLYLYYFLLETRRMLPDHAFPEVVLLDVLHTPYWSTGQYVQGRMTALKEKLEQVCATTITDEALAAAIASVNRSRAALQVLNGLRRETKLTGADLLAAVAAVGCVGPEAATSLARAVLAESEGFEPRPGMRLMVKGAPHDSLDFYRLVESLGAVIVADDHVTGERSFERLHEAFQPVRNAVE